MKPGLIDHAIALIIVVILPITAVYGYRRFMARVRFEPGLRLRGYQNTIAIQWTLVAILLVHWFAVGRERTGIGLDLPLGAQSLVGLAITGLLLLALHAQLVAVRRGGEAALEALRAQLEPVQDLLPRTPTEARWFRAVAVTAGVCEEVLYRGFLIAYLGSLLGALPAVVAAAVMFGIAHLYQGPANALKVFIGSLLAGFLYIGCGSLLWPMILHAAIDLNGGALGRMALATPREE
jgi:uncharacterized protein